jgi:uncharacterized metal-binding protein
MPACSGQSMVSQLNHAICQEGMVRGAATLVVRLGVCAPGAEADLYAAKTAVGAFFLAPQR